MTHRVSIFRRPGFTLLELLLAAGLMSLVVISVFAALRVAFEAGVSAERATEAVRSADIVFDIVRKDLENAVPPTGVLAGAFIGQERVDDRSRPSDSVLFFTTNSGAQHVAADGDVRRVEYIMDPALGGYPLVRKVIHNLTAQEEPPGDPEIVLRDVAGFRLEYWDSANETWLTTWDSTQQNNTMPTMVQVTLDLERPEPQATDGTMRLHRFVRVFQVPCAVPQASTVQGLGGGF